MTDDPPHRVGRVGMERIWKLFGPTHHIGRRNRKVANYSSRTKNLSAPPTILEGKIGRWLIMAPEQKTYWNPTPNREGGL